jgi:hypothetical protein
MIANQRILSAIHKHQVLLPRRSFNNKPYPIYQQPFTPHFFLPSHGSIEDEIAKGYKGPNAYS